MGVFGPRDEYFGVIISQDIINASDLMFEGGSKGIVEHEDEHTLVGQCGNSEVDNTVELWRAADSDVRILKVKRDAAGNRNRPLAGAAPLYTQEDMKDSILRIGPPHRSARFPR